MERPISFTLNGQPTLRSVHGGCGQPSRAVVLRAARARRGEPPVITIDALVANAIHDATGARMLRLPMTPERLLAEIKRPAGGVR